MDYAALSPEELVFACLTSSGKAVSARAWEEFIRRFSPMVTRVVCRTVRRWGEASSTVIDDLTQETYLKLCADNCRLLRTFEFRGPNALYGFLKVVAINVVHDHFKGSRAIKRGAYETREESSYEPSVSYERAIQHKILFRQIEDLLRRSVESSEAKRSRRIFLLYYRCGLTAREIASLPDIGLTTKGVESLILRLTQLIRHSLVDRTSIKDRIDSVSSKKDEGSGAAGVVLK